MRKLQPECDAGLRAAVAASGHRSGELRFMHRLHAVLLVSLGHSCYEVARWIASDPRSVERWVRSYEARGCDGLRDHHGGGRPARLTDAQRADLADALAQSPAGQGFAHASWNGKLVAQLLQRRWAVQLSLRQCHRLLLNARLHP